MSEEHGLSSSERKRQELVRESILGFVGFFTFIALIAGVRNLFQEEPAVWPSLFLLAMVTLLLLVARWHKNHD
ncbi:hypothetical protein ACXM2N_02580 [Corynebacterium sp. ZY180755]